MSRITAPVRLRGQRSFGKKARAAKVENRAISPAKLHNLPLLGHRKVSRHHLGQFFHQVRWGVKMLMDIGTMDIYQVDPTWAGGISELMKICALASAYDVQIMPHGGVEPVLAQVSFTRNAAVTPMIEYQNVLNESKQFFFRENTKPVNGYIYPPESPGVSIEIDENKVEAERDISYS